MWRLFWVVWRSFIIIGKGTTFPYDPSFYFCNDREPLVPLPKGGIIREPLVPLPIVVNERQTTQNKRHMQIVSTNF
jgi:hypothetical protein